MRAATGILTLLGLSPAGIAAAGEAAVPSVFAPGIVSDADSASPAFTPDGRTVYFMRGAGEGSMLMQSQLGAAGWSAPRLLPFSGKWRDLDPALAPDGSFLLFVSNRPASPGAAQLDAVRAGQRQVGKGMNIWKVERRATGWSEPVHLPADINSCSMTFAPNVAADGSIYFIGCAAPDDGLYLKRALYRGGNYLPPFKVSLGAAGAQIRDPAIAPDRSFILFSIKHEPTAAYRLAIAFHSEQGWSAPLDLGDDVNGGTHNMGAQLGCDRRTLYYYSDRAGSAAVAGDSIWQVSLTPWLQAHAGGRPMTPPRPCA
jgi:hypothetical protein